MRFDSSKMLEDVVRALEEDVGTGDVTACLLPPHLTSKAEIISREPMLCCGQPWVNAVFNQVDDKIEVRWLVAEGAYLEEGTTLCTIHGLCRSILTAERTALNFLQTLSGTASKTYQYVQRLKGSQARLLDTRKTIPGLRWAQKYATACAGAMNHRMGLYDAFLIKENHIVAAGSIAAAIDLARLAKKNLFVEVEVEDLGQLQEALTAHPDRILLDNFTEVDLRGAVDMNQATSCELEASGGITLDNIAAIAKTGVDFISVGDLTKSVQAIDLSLLIRDVYEP